MNKLIQIQIGLQRLGIDVWLTLHNTRDLRAKQDIMLRRIQKSSNPERTRLYAIHAVRIAHTLAWKKQY